MKAFQRILLFCPTGLMAIALASASLAGPNPQPVESHTAASILTKGGNDDDEVSSLVAQRSLKENCLICHSAELIETQRLTPKQWKAEVEKMVGWGSPIPAEQVQVLIDYLASNYSTDAKASKLATTGLDEVVKQDAKAVRITTTGNRDRGASLYTTHCANCHGVDGQGAELGPNLVEKPSLLDEAGYADIIRAGRGRMPGFRTLITPAGEADMLAWLRGKPYKPRLPAR